MSDLIRTHSLSVGGSNIFVAETGTADDHTFLFLHGWPESWATWRPVMELGSRDARLVAIDLPGIGGSGNGGLGNGGVDGSKTAAAAVVHQVIEQLGLQDVTLVGHDAGGMVAYAYARQYAGLRALIVMDTVIPGIEPWQEVLTNPYIWHFAFHGIPDLPELLVTGKQRQYFDYFYDVLSADASKIGDVLRAEHAAAYAGAGALKAGFDYYRALPGDAKDNATFAAGPAVETPLLYVRGGHRSGIDIETYAEGFRRAGMSDVRTALVLGAGHFLQEEAPEPTWELIRDFVLSL